MLKSIARPVSAHPATIPAHPSKPCQSGGVFYFLPDKITDFFSLTFFPDRLLFCQLVTVKHDTVSCVLKQNKQIFMKEYLIIGAVVILALVVYFMWVQKALKISAYEAAYERI